MEIPNLSRYKYKLLRHRKPVLQILIDSELEDEPEHEPLFEFLRQRRSCLQKIGQQLYDAVWPNWRQNRTVLMSIQFLEKDEMAELNAKYRGIDAPTDVLTFPLFEENGAFIPPTQLSPLMLGDIILCPSIIQKNAEEHAAAVESELALVIFHGMLHLLAWDHDTPEREAKMCQVQEHFRDLFLEESEREFPANQRKPQ